jgi:hypothetical protein
MDLVAATTPGVGRASTVRAQVKAAGSLPASRTGRYRLVVQTFDDDGDRRPIASVQTAVTAEELREGVEVKLLELRPGEVPSPPESEPVVVAWIEDGNPDLDLDARGARPRRGSLVGLSPRGKGPVTIRLDRRAA